MSAPRYKDNSGTSLQYFIFGKLQQQLFRSCIAERYGCFCVLACSFHRFYYADAETLVFNGRANCKSIPSNCIWSGCPGGCCRLSATV